MTTHSQQLLLIQLYQLTKASMRARYRKTVAGFIWVTINPILLFVAQSIVFKFVLKINLERYFVFILSGLVPWTFITSSISMGTPSLQNSRELLKSFKMTPQVVTLATVLDNFFNFLAAFLFLVLILILMGQISLGSLIYLVFAFPPLLCGVAAMVVFLAQLQIFFRDTVFLVTFALNLLFFLTPIFYPIEYIPEKYRMFALINPFYILIEPFVIALYKDNISNFIVSLVKSFSLSFFFSTIAYLYWAKRKNEFYARL